MRCAMLSRGAFEGSIVGRAFRMGGAYLASFSVALFAAMLPSSDAVIVALDTCPNAYYVSVTACLCDVSSVLAQEKGNE